MFAPKAYARGDTIVSSEAFLIGPGCSPFHFQGADGVLRYPAKKPICLGCYTFLDGKYKCTRCHWPVCDAVCQDVDWHKDYECPLLMKNKREYVSMEKDKIMYYHITLLRAILLSSRSPTQWARVAAAVETRAREFELTCGSSNMCKLAHLIGTVFNLPDPPEARTLAGIYRTFQLDGIFNHLPNDRCCTVIYAELLAVTYSCVPSGRYVHLPPIHPTQPFIICFYALDDIPQDAPVTRCLDESLLLQGTFNRRHALKDLFQYLCQCPRCVDPTELGSNLTAVGCPQIKCRAAGGKVLPVYPLDERLSSVWKCSRCKYKTTQKEVRDFLEVAVQIVVQSTLVTPENILERSALVNLVDGVERILSTSSNIVGMHHYSILPLRIALLGLISSNLSTINDPLLRSEYAQKMIDEVHVLIFVLHHVMPGGFPIKGKTYYWMAKALMTHLTTIPGLENTQTTRELLHYVITNHLPTLKQIQHSPQLPGIGDVTPMINDLELWSMQCHEPLLQPLAHGVTGTTDTKKPLPTPSEVEVSSVPTSPEVKETNDTKKSRRTRRASKQK